MQAVYSMLSVQHVEQWDHIVCITSGLHDKLVDCVHTGFDYVHSQGGLRSVGILELGFGLLVQHGAMWFGTS